MADMTPEERAIKIRRRVYGSDQRPWVEFVTEQIRQAEQVAVAREREECAKWHDKEAAKFLVRANNVMTGEYNKDKEPLKDELALRRARSVHVGSAAAIRARGSD